MASLDLPRGFKSATIISTRMDPQRGRPTFRQPQSPLVPQKMPPFDFLFPLLFCGGEIEVEVCR